MRSGPLLPSWSAAGLGCAVWAALLAWGCEGTFPERPELLSDSGPPRGPGDATGLGVVDGGSGRDAAPRTPLRPDAAPAPRFDAGPPVIAVDAAPPAPPGDAARDAEMPPDVGREDAAVERDMMAPPPPPLCWPEHPDDPDDIEQGRDSPSCGAFIERNCNVWFGVNTDVTILDEPLGPLGAWGNCPARDLDDSHGVRCMRSTGRGSFEMIGTSRSLAAGNALAVRFDCVAEAAPDLASYIDSRCRVVLGFARAAVEMEASPLSWAGCPGAANNPRGIGFQGEQSCTSTGGDRMFHALRIVNPGPILEGDKLGLAFVCTDPDRPAFAAAIQASVEIYLGWARRARSDRHQSFPLRGEMTWGRCPEDDEYEDDDVSCAGTRADGKFSKIVFGEDAHRDHKFGLMLRRRPLAKPPALGDD